MAKPIIFRTTKKGMQAALPLAVVAMGVPLQSSVPHFVAESAQTGSMNTCTSAVEITDSCAGLTVNVWSGDSRKWSTEDERRFLTLAKKDALNQASAQEVQRLEELEAERNRLKYPYGLDELIWYAKQEETRKTLIEAMQNFLSMQQPSRWSRAETNW